MRYQRSYRFREKGWIMRLRGTPWTTKQIAELRELVKYLSIAAIGAKYGISTSRVYFILKREGIVVPRKRKWSAKEALENETIRPARD